MALPGNPPRSWEDIRRALDKVDARMESLELRFGDLKLVVGVTGNNFDFAAAAVSDTVAAPFGTGTLQGGVAMAAGIGGPSYNVAGQVSGSDFNMIMQNIDGAVTTSRSAYYLLWGTP